MTTQQGLELGQAGMELALQARQDWAIKATIAIEALINSRHIFTSDDLVELVGLPGGSNKALGAVIGKYSRAGLIIRCGFKHSTRSSRHGGYVFKWQGVIK